MNDYFSNEEILAKAKEVAKHLSSTEQVRFYKQAEEKISANQKVQALVDEIKKYQKESVNLQHFQKHEAYRQNEAKIDELQKELDSIPVVMEFKQSQGEVNDFLQLIVNLVSSRITDSGENSSENIK
ncbi:RicAFT regulatory complex protein RicA family protein [Sporolactobacillus pectinivorans]|uniref:RicAFT regulatory complex protein RicA family protein n=1 Tax=Sporolactobacillus pectinivorans TaxID=1591408 RepID=UPI000C26BE2B|nr:YlbF family regulator [Sporolactobacillus pectinivorans]